ncbi:MAG: hypothetical protein ACR2NN_18645 [Bryobacteraceae bacterium]
MIYVSEIGRGGDVSGSSAFRSRTALDDFEMTMPAYAGHGRERSRPMPQEREPPEQCVS